MLKQASVNILTNHRYNLPIKELPFVVLLPLLSGVCKFQGQKNQFQALGKCSTTSYACLEMCSSISYVFEFACLLESEPTLIMEEFSTAGDDFNPKKISSS